MLTQAADSGIRDLTRHCVARYVAQGFSSDPILAELRWRGGRTRDPIVRTLSPREISDHSYRRHFYDEAAVRQKMSALAQIDDRLIYLNFYRDPDQADFQEGDRRMLCDLGQVLCALLARHHRMKASEAHSVPSVEQSEGFRRQLRDQVRNALVAEKAGLTEREADVCAEIAVGRSAAQIAAWYGISLNTVATHRKRAYGKLGISSQSELFARYYESLTNRVLGAAATQ
jgi:DNA-binding CsgD family transcriptional regulator